MRSSNLNLRGDVGPGSHVQPLGGDVGQGSHSPAPRRGCGGQDHTVQPLPGDVGQGSHGPAPWSPVFSSVVTLGFLCDPCRLESPLHSGRIPQQGETEPISRQAQLVLWVRPFLPHPLDTLQLWMKRKLPLPAATPRPSRSGDLPGAAGASPGSGLLVQAAVEGPSPGVRQAPSTAGPWDAWAGPGALRG